MKRLRREDLHTSDSAIERRKKIFRVFKVGLVCLFALLFIEIWLSSRLATYGNKIQELKTAQAELKLENQILENSIAEHTSLISLEPQATALGFTTIKTIEYMKPLNLAAAF
ncbi:MAG: hypothetical protein Q7S44_03455 [bacterium]|nr:hypothetical protein [bacterium]